MDREIIDKYKKAGEITRKALEHGSTLVKEGAFVFDIAESMEKKVISLGGRLAFPVNISINDVAAHYTPVAKDTLTIKSTDYVKLDCGAHIDGYIADSALTVRVAGKDELMKCAEKMLDEALKVFKIGNTLGQVGSAAEAVADEFGFKPIINLTGHSLSQYDLHAGDNVPSVKVDNRIKIEEGRVYAVEPFCTTGGGWVKESPPALIYRWIADHPIRTAEGRKILEMSKNDFSKLPFAKRWLQREIGGLKLEQALRQLQSSGAIYGYPILKESTGKPVAQREHTIIVLDKPIVTTR